MIRAWLNWWRRRRPSPPPTDPPAPDEPTAGDILDINRHPYRKRRP